MRIARIADALASCVDHSKLKVVPHSAGCAQKRVANLWTEFAARDGYAMGTNRKECKKPSKSLVAATFEKAKTYIFARPKIRDREVGGSNPLAPTIYIKHQLT